MKIFKKLNSKGFGHLELLIVIVVVALVAGTGFFVYQHHKKHDVAHAGSWTYIGAAYYLNQKPDITYYACKEPVTTVFGNLWLIKGLQIGSKNNPLQPSTMQDGGSPNGLPNIANASPPSGWFYGVASSQFYVNPNVTNYIDFSGPAIDGYVRAGTLVNC